MTFGRERHDTLEHDDDTFEDEPSRSIFSATWFRALLVFIALAVIAVVAMPYALEWANPPAKTRGIAKGTRTPAAEAPTSPPPVSGPVPVAVVPKPTPSATATPDSTSPATTTEPRVVPSIPSPAETPAPRAQEPARAAAGSRATATTPQAGTTPPPASTPAQSTAVPHAPTPPGLPQGSTPPQSTTLAQGSAPSSSAVPPQGAPLQRPASVPDATASQGAVGATESSKAMEPVGTTDTQRAARAPKRLDVARAPEASTREATRPPAAGPFWIQVGAFRDPETARRVVEKLREQQFPVADPEKMVAGVPTTSPVAPTPTLTPTPAAGPDRYDVFVSGIAAGDLNTRIEPRSLTADPVAGGAVVKPSLPLADAVALAKELSGDGLRVQVRRASGSAHATTTTATAATTEPQTLYRVRVGSYPDRTAALAALHDLEAKGFKPFLARGAQ